MDINEGCMMTTWKQKLLIYLRYQKDPKSFGRINWIPQMKPQNTPAHTLGIPRAHANATKLLGSIRSSGKMVQQQNDNIEAKRPQQNVPPKDFTAKRYGAEMVTER